ncbi:hypothetical protein [Halalkalicoccus salilacus]|uniref:hypothetical protein n=1 Tax=Halalkalicoccus TaxID=332246 RepID=UPI002F96B863
MTFLDHDPVVDAAVIDLPGLGDTSFDVGIGGVGGPVPVTDALAKSVAGGSAL